MIDFQKLQQTLYIQRRYMQCVGVENPVFVFTVPKQERLEIEAHILRHLETWFGGKIKLKDASQTPNSSRIDLGLPAYTKWMMPAMQATILLLDKDDIDEILATAP